MKNYLKYASLCIGNIAYCLGLTIPLVRLVKITTSHTGMYCQLIAVIALAVVYLVMTFASIFDRKSNWLQVISGVLFYGCLCFMDFVLWGSIGLLMIAILCGGKAPTQFFVLMVLFNCGWGWGSTKVEQPARIQDNYTHKESGFLFMLRQISNIVLPKIDASSWGKTFTTNTRVEFNAGPVMNIKAGSDFKVTEISKSSYGSVYKIDSSKPVSFGVGIAQVKFKTATLEVSNNYQTKVIDGDLTGNKWLMKYIFGNTFDLRF